MPEYSLRTDFNAQALATLATAAPFTAARRLEMIARLYRGDDFETVMDEASFEKNAALYWITRFNEEGPDSLSDKQVLSRRNLVEDLPPAELRSRAALVKDATTKRRLVALAQLYESEAAVNVAKEAGVTIATLATWVEVFNKTDRYAFIWVSGDGQRRQKLTPEEIEVARLTSVKYDTGGRNAFRFEAVSLAIMGAFQAEIGRLCGASGEEVADWVKSYRISGPYSLVSTRAAEPRANPQRQSKPLISFEAAEFARKNRVEKLLQAADEAAGPMEASIFKALSIRAGGDESSLTSVPCVNLNELKTAARKLQDGDIEHVRDWIRSQDGFEVPAISVIEEFAETVGEPGRKNLKGIVAHLNGATAEDVAEQIGVPPRSFRDMFVGFRKFGFDAYRVMMDSQHKRPNKPRPNRKGLVKEMPFSSAEMAARFRDSILPLKATLNQIERLNRPGHDGVQKDIVDTLRHVLKANSVAELERLGADYRVRRVVEHFNHYGEASVMSGVVAEGFMPPRDIVSMRAMRAMADNDNYRFQSHARALLGIARGTHPLSAAMQEDVNPKELRHMAKTLRSYVQAFDPYLFAAYRREDLKAAKDDQSTVQPSEREERKDASPTYPLKAYQATEEQLEELGVASVWEFVDLVNEHLKESGHRPLSVGDFPSNKNNFQRLVKRWDAIRGLEGFYQPARVAGMRP
jgi:transposase